MKLTLENRVIAAVVGLGAFALISSSASAAIVCNQEGDCWHVKEHYDYQPAFGLTVHDDNWNWEAADQNRYRWREHEGRGYWRNGVWITF